MSSVLHVKVSVVYMHPLILCCFLALYVNMNRKYFSFSTELPSLHDARGEIRNIDVLTLIDPK